MQEAMGGGYGRMGTMGHLGQMGQMMRRNGNIFQMLPIKKIWEFCQNSGGGFSQIPLFFYKRNCHKMGCMVGGGGGRIPIFPLFYWERPLILRLLLQCNHTISLTYLNRWGTWWRTIWRLRSTLLRLPPLPVESMLSRSLGTDRRD